jgi:signal transduction histidine kinase/DNA-binding LacI/PurR family transcriptional regulator
MAPSVSPPPRNHPEAPRRTIGLLTARIGRAWGREFIAGVTDAARALDINLRIFVCRQVGGSEFSLYNLVDPASLDGLILAADLGHGVSQAEIEQFCARFQPLPMLALSLEVPGIPSIHTDSFNGMRQAVLHLIEEHGLRRIAFVRGPQGQSEAEQRYQAYLSALETHAIPLDERLVAPGDFTPESGLTAIALLLDERRAHFQAVVTANDRMAFGVLDALQQRHRQVPAEVALVGFDDVTEAQALGVPLTTVRQPFYATGHQAVHLLLDLLQGKAVPDQSLLPTELVIRWSCGCLPPAIQQVRCDETLMQPQPETSTLAERRQPTIEALAQIIHENALPGVHLVDRRIRQSLGKLWEAFLNDLSAQNNSRFLQVFSQILAAAQPIPLREGISVWHSLLSEFRRQVLPYLVERSLFLHAENLLEQARILIGEAAQRTQASQRLIVEHQEELFQALGATLTSLVSMKEIAAAAQQHFSGLGIQRCYLSLYDTTGFGPLNIPVEQLNARLVLQYQPGQAQWHPNESEFPASQLLPPGLIPADRRYSAIITPLGLAQSPLGILWNEIGPSDWEVYIRLSNLLSSALFRTLLIRQREQAMQEIGQLLVHAEQHAIELALAKETAEEAARRTQQALQEADGLFRAALAILGATVVTDICQKLTTHYTSLVQADQVIIFLVDHDQEKIQLGVHNGCVLDELGVSYAELKEGVNGITFESGQPVLSQRPEDGFEPPDPVERRIWGATGSIVVVPLVAKGKVIGTVTALNQLDQRLFTQHDVNLLMSLAAQAAAAIDGAHLYQAEQERRQVAETLVQAGRKLTSTLQLREVPSHILEQLHMVVLFERASLILQEGESLRIVAQRGFPDRERTRQLTISIREGDVYQQVVAAGRPLLVGDVTRTTGWSQVDWLPLNLSWMGVPLFAKERVIGMLSITRREANAFSQDDAILAATFALQAAIALENAALYDEITRFNEQLEQMVAQRTEELNAAYKTLEKLNENKTVFINVAAHELRTPLTVIKGYTGMLEADPAVIQNEYLMEVLKGIHKGTERLHAILNSMLDVARIDSQLLDLHLETTALPVMLKRVLADYSAAAAERQLSLELENVDGLPLIAGDPDLLLKVFKNLVSNAIKYTPDGGRITLRGGRVVDARLGDCVEIQVQDTGIGIDPDHQELIFEKFYQTGTVALHSTGETKFMGGGTGLGLAIVRGIVNAHGGRIWAESSRHDPVGCPGSTFFVRLPRVEKS